MNTKIFIATHKSYTFPEQAAYIPIHAGKAISQLDLQVQGDNTGNHISPLNPNFCELTVLYWIWKNCTADIQGLVHYRRYFSYQNNDDFNIQHLNQPILNANILHTLLPSDNQIILPKPQSFGKYRYFLWLKKRRSVYQQYQLCHFEKDWLKLENVVGWLYPKYMPALNKVKNCTEMSCFNMFIAHKSFINAYCTWLFDILFELRKHLNISSYDHYQQRIFGFMAERLLNVYVCHHAADLDIQYLDITFLE